MITLTNYEQETIINFNEEEAITEIYTASSRVYKLLAARGIKPYKIDNMNGKPSGWYYTFPKSAIILKPGKHGIRLGGSRKINSVPSCDALGVAAEGYPLC